MVAGMAKLVDRPVFHPGLGAYFQALRSGRKLGSLRVAARVAREQQLDVTYQVLQRLEAGRTLNPDPTLIQSLARLYKRPYAELVAAFVEARFGTSIQDLGRATGIEPSNVTLGSEEFGAVPLMKGRIAAGSPLVIDDDEYSGALAFGTKWLSKWKRPLCVRVGPREESMIPLIAPNDVVLLECDVKGLDRPDPSAVYAVRADGGSTLKRVELVREGARAWLALLSENPDKKRYAVRMLPIEEGSAVADYLVGRVVWHGQHM
jgi:phage repressor protein C with HTH and peptisase S24 domain